MKSKARSQSGYVISRNQMLCWLQLQLNLHSMNKYFHIQCHFRLVLKWIYYNYDYSIHTIHEMNGNYIFI